MAGNIRPSGDGYIVGTYTVDNAAISRGQFVSLFSTSAVRACNELSAPYGVALTDGAVGESIEIVRGYCLALAGEGITAASATECSVDSTGRLVAAGDYRTTAAYVAANPAADAAAAGDLFPVIFNVYLSTANHL